MHILNKIKSVLSYVAILLKHKSSSFCHLSDIFIQRGLQAPIVLQ